MYKPVWSQYQFDVSLYPVLVIALVGILGWWNIHFSVAELFSSEQFACLSLPAELALQTEWDRFTEWMCSSSVSQVSSGCSKYALIAYCVSIIAVKPFRANIVLLCWKPPICVCPTAVAANYISLTTNTQHSCSLFWLCCLFLSWSLACYDLWDQTGN